MASIQLLSHIIQSFDTTSATISHDCKHNQYSNYSFAADNSIQYIYDVNKIRNFVTKKIAQMEQEYGFKVLFAVEKSSHIWGTSHSKSDNDVQCFMFYDQRSYYSIINSCAQDARNKQNKKMNLRNRKKLRQLDEYKNNKFFRDIKIQYGPRYNHDNDIKDEDIDNKTLDVEISYHDIPKWMQLIKESNQSLYEMISSPLIYYHLYDMKYINIFRNIIWNLYDYIRLSESYYHVARGNYRTLTHENKNRSNKDARMKVKTLFLIWRCVLMAQWLLDNKTVRYMPLYLPRLIENTKLLNKIERHMLMDKLKNELNRAMYNVDDEFDVLAFKLKDILDKLGKDIEYEYEKQLCTNNEDKEMREENEKALETLFKEMVESFDKFGDVEVSTMEYNYKVNEAFPAYQLVNYTVDYLGSDLLTEALQFFETKKVFINKLNKVDGDELLLRMDELISLTDKAINAIKYSEKIK